MKKIIQALEILQEDKEESKLIYGVRISKVFDEVCLDILIDKAIASKYKAFLVMRLGVYPRKIGTGWNLPLEFVEEKYGDVEAFSFRFKDN